MIYLNEIVGILLCLYIAINFVLMTLFWIVIVLITTDWLDFFFFSIGEEKQLLMGTVFEQKHIDKAYQMEYLEAVFYSLMLLLIGLPLFIYAMEFEEG